MKKRLLIALVLLLLPLTGSRQPARRTVRIVNRAEVVFYQPGRLMELQLRDPGKLTSLMNCLRLASPYGNIPAPDPTGHLYRITLHYSDQSQQVCYLQDYRYFSPDGTTWQKVRTNEIHYFYLLLHLLPPDR